MSIKEQIAALLDWTKVVQEAGEEGYAVDTESYNWVLCRPSLRDMSVADLKALADSHTRLLQAAKDVKTVVRLQELREQAIKDGQTFIAQVLINLVEAIEEAEKL